MIQIKIVLVALLLFESIVTQQLKLLPIGLQFLESEKAKYTDQTIIRVSDTFFLNVTLNSNNLYILLKDYINWKYYYRLYSQEDIGRQINKNFKFTDLTKIFQCGDASNEQITYNFGTILSSMSYITQRVRCFKIEDEGKITAYMTLMEKGSKKQTSYETKLELKLMRDLKQIEIEKVKNGFLMKDLKKCQNKLAQQKRLKKYFKYGVVNFPLEGQYMGYFTNGKRNGNGKMFYLNEDVYNGDWLNDVRQGYGSYRNKKSMYVGQFKAGKRHGLGIVRYHTGEIFKGNFLNDGRHSGQIFFSSGERIQENRQYKENGEAIITWSTGMVYQGGVENGVPHGKGVVHYEDGRIEYGLWNNGLKQGKTILQQKNGVMYQLTYEQGAQINRIRA